MPDQPLDHAQEILVRTWSLLRECRKLLPKLEAPAARETEGQEGERIAYLTIMAALEEGLNRTLHDVLRVLRQSQPLGPMGQEWLRRQGWLN